MLVITLFACGKGGDDKSKEIATSSQSLETGEAAIASQKIRALAKDMTNDEWAFCKQSTIVGVSVFDNMSNKTADEIDGLERMRAMLRILDLVGVAKVENGENKTELDSLAMNMNDNLVALVKKDPNSPAFWLGWVPCRDKVNLFVK